MKIHPFSSAGRQHAKDAAANTFPGPKALDRSLFFLLSGLIMLGISVILSLCSRRLSGFAQTYSVTVYAVIKNILGRFSSLFPFSLSEAGICLLIPVSLAFFIRNLRRPLKLLSRAFFLASALLLSFTLNCGINYYRNPFSYEAGILPEKSSREELYALCEYLTEQVNESISQMENRTASELPADAPEDFPGQTEETPIPSRNYLKTMGEAGREAMSDLGRLYPQLGGWYPRPKPLFLSRLLSVQQLCGIYSPFTVEANYNREMPYYNIPHTICHELSHLKGFMREDEANFIGYLACIGSPSADFRYSGFLTGWVYTGNALAKVDYEGYCRLHEQLNEKAISDLDYNNRFWDRFEGKVAEASNQLNDQYLKVHSQTDGVQSYGRMVDLMLAYYKEGYSQ